MTSAGQEAGAGQTDEAGQGTHADQPAGIGHAARGDRHASRDVAAGQGGQAAPGQPASAQPVSGQFASAQPAPGQPASGQAASGVLPPGLPAGEQPAAARQVAPGPPGLEQSREDTDVAWGEYRRSDDEDRLYRDRPPHWADY